MNGKRKLKRATIKVGVWTSLRFAIIPTILKRLARKRSRPPVHSSRRVNAAASPDLATLKMMSPRKLYSRRFSSTKILGHKRDGFRKFTN